MARWLLLFLGWLVAAFALWVLLVALEIYWNLRDWQPRLDSRFMAIGLGVSAALAVMWMLARVGRQRSARAVALVICLALLSLGVYVLPAEPLTSGLFAREIQSPLWYRGGRLGVLALPMLFWTLALFRLNTTARQADAPLNRPATTPARPS